MKNINGIELFLLDMDGTLYLGDEPLPGAPDAVMRIRLAHKKVCFLTNNSSKSRTDYVEKLNRLGFEAAIDEVYTSGLACIEYLKKRYVNRSVYLLGTEALREEFLLNGIKLTDGKPDIVVIGYDTGLTYARLSRACVYIRDGAKYLATHSDLNCPAPGGYVPDTGSFIELIKASTGRTPDIICGKPFNVMASAIRAKYGAVPEKTAMVGDRLTTDLRFAKNNGYYSVLVLSEETDLKMLKKYPDKPDLVLNSIANLLV